MPNISNYIKHNTGIWGMIQFLDSYLQYGYKYEIKNKVIVELSSFYSQHIGIGSVKNKKLGKNYFITVSQQLYNSLSLINFDKIVINTKESRIYFISKNVLGDNKSWPTIPVFVLSIYLENLNKIDFLECEKKIDIKPHYFNDNDEVIIDHKNSFNLNIYTLPDKENIYNLIPNQIDDYYSLMDLKLKNTINKYSSYVPEFKGDYVESDLHKKLKENGVFHESK